LFLEPEGIVKGSKYADSIYLQGLSTSLPYDVQEEIIRSIPALENAKILEYAYAIEYDAVDSCQLKHTLESKSIANLYFAGQVNGTSGYEEAACQGLMAGINAVLKLQNKEEFILKRNEAYIGVLIDDLVLKGVSDPYRLLTSRAEYRLLIRDDNAYERLFKYSIKFNLTDDQSIKNYEKEKEIKDSFLLFLKSEFVKPSIIINEYLKENNLDTIINKITLFEFLQRKDTSIKNIEDILNKNFNLSSLEEKIEIEVKYSGYIQKELREVEKMLKMESRIIPFNIDYNDIVNLAYEAREKLNRIKPKTIAEAQRISGVNPVDITMILFYLDQKNDKI
jgi:tRNA uridine 5-carboxymethylaminomethyl modification enzyme